MARASDLLPTALAPVIWGSTYLTTTELLPEGYPLTMALLRALPAGLLLLLAARRLPPRRWLGRLLLLGAFNFSIFWALLFVAAYALPGGVAATLGAAQTLIVILLARLLLGAPITAAAVAAALTGLAGVALLVLTPAAALNPIGVLAGLGGAAAMAAGTVLSRKWGPLIAAETGRPLSPLVFTAWQLTAGGLLLAPAALLLEPPLPPLEPRNLLGVLYLGLFGAALSYALWFRGVARLEPAAVSLLGALSPLAAVLLGWAALGESLTAWQTAGAALVLASVTAGQFAAGRPRPANARPA